MALTTASSASKTQIRSSLPRWQGNIGEDLRPLFAAFVDETLNRLRGPFLAHHPPKQVLTYLEEAFRFALDRQDGELHAELRRRSGRGVSVLINMADQPFIVDTVRLFLRSHGADNWGGFSFVFRARRTADGRLAAVGEEDGSHESLVLLEADVGDLGDLAAATAALRQNLELARAMVRDFKAMTRTAERFGERCELLADRRPDQSEKMRETAAFLKWLGAENFVFMGVDGGEAPLGIQTVPGPTHHTADGTWPTPHFPGTVFVRKSTTESPVHRAGRIDEILVRVSDGTDTHQLFLRGMFTYRAVTQPSRHVPILRGVLADILNDQTTTGPGSFRYKGIANVFDSLPTEFLFTAPRQAISDMVERVFEAEQQQEVGVTFTLNGHDSGFCLVAMPKTQFGDDLRRELEQEIVRTTRATYCDHGVFVGRYDTVLLHYFLTGIRDVGPEVISSLTERVRELASPWLGRLWNDLSERLGEEEADRLVDRYGKAFPDSWTRSTTTTRAIADIQLLERLLADGRVQADVFEVGDDLILRVYQQNDVYLSDLMPVLSNFGIKVIDSYATEVTVAAGALHVDTFRLEGAEGCDRATLLERAPLLVEAIAQVFSGSLSDDRINALVLVGGLSWSEVDMLRGYMRYSRQIGMKLSVVRMTEIMLAHPIMFGSLVRLFRARFDPDLAGDRAQQMAAAGQVVTDELRYIQAHDEDLLVSTVRNLIESTVRTNFYRADGRGFLSFKFDASKVKLMSGNRPMFEIWVHSRDVEGIHLRFGKVARGGIRWSDRDDFRTEVLGLVTTQRVKNVVIVPTGSKGGFLLKNASRDPGERRRQADELYKTFIRGLLDLTDNSVGGKIVPPGRVVRHDEDDPYLVVAADKGTAHLSDTANALSIEYGFWLGDAFASGGSNGYDHKKVGITARGAWVLAKRHFAEMGIDPYSQDVTVVGIGDLGGDVFGNGLIESKHLKLRAAFNHIHIFLDPDPDSARSYEERLRLFKAGMTPAGGGWEKYDTSLISKGGGVFDRRAKSVPLSPECRVMLGIDREEAQPEEVIHAILLMQADLLWNGGIGTYIKASTETHADADDRSNDAIRIDATELKVKVIGEGGNLGLTQKARIEAGLLGIRLNNDAVDNSAGVDLSDHEVNLKILLNRVVERGEMTVDQRNTLLSQMTDEVAGLVLEDNDAHGRQLSRDQIRSRENIFPFGRAIAFIEREFGRDRSTLDLPSDKELDRRAANGLGLTRPELAVLSSWVKMYVKRELLKGDPKQIPGYDVLLRTYFPKVIQERFPGDIQGHMLANEIAVTVAITRVMADAGASFFPIVIESTGCSVMEIMIAYRKAARIARHHEVRGSLEDLRSTVALDALYRAWVEVDKGTREVAVYWLSSSGTIPADEVIDEMRHTVEQVYDLQASEVTARNRAKLESLRAQGLPEEIARLIVKTQYLNLGLTVFAESKRTGTAFDVIAVRHLAIGRASKLQQVLDDLASRPATGRWDPLAMRILYTRFQGLLRQTVAKCPIDVANASVDALEPQLATNRLADVRTQVDEMLGRENHPSVAALLVLEERVASAIARL
ncbi:MAG: NAD-glutamate dehydrogenase domain-containing protein [Myxococcota bacterium]